MSCAPPPRIRHSPAHAPELAGQVPIGLPTSRFRRLSIVICRPGLFQVVVRCAVYVLLRRCCSCLPCAASHLPLRPSAAGSGPMGAVCKRAFAPQAVGLPLQDVKPCCCFSQETLHQRNLQSVCTLQAANASDVIAMPRLAAPEAIAGQQKPGLSRPTTQFKMHQSAHMRGDALWQGPQGKLLVLNVVGCTRCTRRLYCNVGLVRCQGLSCSAAGLVSALSCVCAPILLRVCWAGSWQLT